MKYWVIKAKPARNQLQKMLKPGKSDSWGTKKPPENWSNCDRLFIWSSWPDMFVVGLGTLKKITDKDQNGSARASLKYLTPYLENVITIDELRDVKELRDASFLQSGPSGTFFPLTTVQGDIVKELVENRNPEWKESWPSLLEMAEDLNTPPPRLKAITYRIVRDTEKTKALKEIYNYRCQVCRKRISITENKFYCEVHHIRPLGQPHNGEDEKENMIVLCPNHHAMFDLGLPVFENTKVVRIKGKSKKLLFQHEHEISSQNIKHHNQIHEAKVGDIR